MLSFYSRLSPAQQLVVSGVASILGTALVVTVAATWQFYTTSGHLDIGVLINFAVLTFAALISKSLHDYIPSHAQLELQALRDSEERLHAAVERQQLISRDALNTRAVAPSQSQNVPLVAIHTPQVTMSSISPPDASIFKPAPPPDVSKLETAAVPVPQVPFPDVPTQRIEVPAQPTMPEIPALHFGDSQIVPVAPTP